MASVIVRTFWLPSQAHYYRPEFARGRCLQSFGRTVVCLVLQLQLHLQFIPIFHLPWKNFSFFFVRCCLPHWWRTHTYLSFGDILQTKPKPKTETEVNQKFSPIWRMPPCDASTQNSNLRSFWWVLFLFSVQSSHSLTVPVSVPPTDLGLLLFVAFQLRLQA